MSLVEYQVDDAVAVITLSRGDEILYTKEIKGPKDGGLDWYQAHQRSAAIDRSTGEDAGLIKQLKEDAQLNAELTAEILGALAK